MIFNWLSTSPRANRVVIKTLTDGDVRLLKLEVTFKQNNDHFDKPTEFQKHNLPFPKSFPDENWQILPQKLRRNPDWKAPF